MPGSCDTAIPLKVAACACVIPIVAVFLGTAFTGERLTICDFMWAALIMASVALAIMAPQMKAKPATPVPGGRTRPVRLIHGMQAVPPAPACLAESFRVGRFFGYLRAFYLTRFRVRHSFEIPLVVVTLINRSHDQSDVTVLPARGREPVFPQSFFAGSSELGVNSFEGRFLPSFPDFVVRVLQRIATRQFEHPDVITRIAAAIVDRDALPVWAPVSVYQKAISRILSYQFVSRGEHKGEIILTAGLLFLDNFDAVSAIRGSEFLRSLLFRERK